MSPLGRLTTMILMFIGDSPNSMAGGIKTTTLFIILMFIFKIPNSKGDIRIKDKRINQRLIMKALRVFIYTLLITITSIVLIRIFEPNTISTESIEVIVPEPDMELIEGDKLVLSGESSKFYALMNLIKEPEEVKQSLSSVFDNREDKE